MSSKKNKLIRKIVGKAIAQMSLSSNEARWLYDQLKKSYSKGRIHNIGMILDVAQAKADDRRRIEHADSN